METLLAALTGAALIVLLLVVAIGVYLITEELKKINRTMAKISWGVRAIEGETDLLTAHVPPLIETFAGLDGGAKVIAERLTSAERRLAAAGALLAAGKGGQ
ncbi:MAG TPA: hypothetical protein VFW12_03820 [Candidatus Limnocylindria bacterium]|nr:hypothetical protein [Candidatus Limnocylindria bacterium]